MFIGFLFIPEFVVEYKYFTALKNTNKDQLDKLYSKTTNDNVVI